LWGLTMDGDENLSPAAQLYIKYYTQKWEEADQKKQDCINDGDTTGEEKYQKEMDDWHKLANDIREKDANGEVSGAVLNVPVYNQLDVPNGNGTNLCWACCIAMDISYRFNDKRDRTMNIGKAIAVHSQYDPSIYNIPRAWTGVAYTGSLIGITNIRASEKQVQYDLSLYEIENIIDSGNTFGVLYRSQTSGHWVLGIGYAKASGHDSLIISNDPWKGVQRIESFADFYTYEDGRVWSYSVIPN